jgi:hypothetical protein
MNGIIKSLTFYITLLAFITIGGTAFASPLWQGTVKISTVLLGADTSQQPLLAIPQHP